MADFRNPISIMMQNKGKIYVKKFIILLFWLGVWQILAMCVDNFLLVVTPLQALQALLTLAGQVEFWRSAFDSLWRIAFGFCWGGIGTSSGGHQLPLSAGGRSPASFHGILQGSTGSGICSAFADLVGFFHAGGGYLFSGSISEYLPEYAGRTKERGQRAVRDGGGIPPSPWYSVLLHLPSGVKAFLLSAFQLSLGMCWKSGVAAEVIGTPSHSIGGALYLAKIYLDTADLFAWTAVIVVLSVFLKNNILRD